MRSSHAGLAWARSASTASKSMSLTAASKSPVASDPNRYRPTRDDPVTVTIAWRMEPSKASTAASDVDGLQPFMDNYAPARHLVGIGLRLAWSQETLPSGKDVAV